MEEPGNWRPISLVCTASKLFAGCLARRLMALNDSHCLLALPAERASSQLKAVWSTTLLCIQSYKMRGGPGKNVSSSGSTWKIHLGRSFTKTSPTPSSRRRSINPAGSCLENTSTALFSAKIKVSNRGAGKTSTILIHIKGHLDSPSSWRPISLINTVAKIFTGCINRRFLVVIEKHQLLSPAQKGFLQSEGCLEHNFILQSLIQDAKRRRKEISIAWLDLTNAFDSVPHSVIFAALQSKRFHPNTVRLIMNLYKWSSTCFALKDGFSTMVTVWRTHQLSCLLMLTNSQSSAKSHIFYKHSSMLQGPRPQSWASRSTQPSAPPCESEGN